MSITDKNWSEERLQQECWRWFWNQYPDLRGLLFHVPNGGTRNSREAAKFKSMGLVRGVSDFIFLHNCTAYFIELKRPDGKGGQSKYQKEWERKVREYGYYYHVVNTLDSFQATIKGIIATRSLIYCAEDKK